MIRKKLLVSIMGIALLNIGATGTSHSIFNLTPETVSAAKAYKIKLKHNAYIYSKNGKRKGKKVLKAGKTLTAYGKTKIKNKKYYRLAKKRYIKAANVKMRTKKINNRILKMAIINKSTKVYDRNGKATAETLRKGERLAVYGTLTIKEHAYYKLNDKGSRNILVSDTVNTGKIPAHTSNSQLNNETSIDSEPGRAEKPTPSEVRKLLASGNDKVGYAVYFSDDQLAQIKRSLWQKIQNYRLENGYPIYKSNGELDNFISEVSSTSTNMFLYADDINSSDIEKYLPTLAYNEMNAIRSVDNYRYYGNYRGAPAVFNIKDRNTEHVAAEIFNSLKNDPFYSETILGKDDRLSFGSLGLNYYWDGNSSCVGLVFIEVAGSSERWISYYNVN